MKRIFFLFAVSILTFSTLISCGGKAGHIKTIAVSIPPQAALLGDIVGDSMDIVTLMPAEANPEAFEITVRNMRTISDAALYMKIGNLPFEETLTERISESNPELKFADVSKGIELIYGTHSHGGDAVEVADPHTWTSVNNLKKIASNMLEEVTTLDPERKEYYAANYERLIAHLDSVNNVISGKIDNAGGKAFLIWHPSLSYFARDYGLHQIAVGQDNKEMTPGQLREVHEHALQDGAKVMFMQKNFDAGQAKTIAEAINAEIVVINPMDSDYINQFNIIANAISRQ